MTSSHLCSERDVTEELFRRQRTAGDTVVDNLVATDMVNHAAGPQEEDLVVHHVRLRGTHRASTMPPYADPPVTGRSAAWTSIHIWLVAHGMLVEHWPCRDDIGVLDQLRPS